MTMGSIGGAFTTASGFLGLGARARTEPASTRTAFEDDDAFVPHLDGLAPGQPCFEAVAQALAEAGYLDG